MGLLGWLIIGNYYKGKNSDEKYEIILIPKALDVNNDFWSSLMAGAKLGAQENNVNLSVMGVYHEGDVKGQIEKIKEAIDLSPDAIVIAPGDGKAPLGILKEAKEKGIKIILIDSILDEKLGESVVATNNIKAGKELGTYAQRLLKEDDQILMVGHVEGTSTAIQREAGMREALGGFENNIQEVIFTGSSYDQAYDDTTKLIEKYPDAKLIMTMNEYSAVGAARAVEAAGKSGTIKMVGFDNSIEEIQMLERGVFEAIVIQQPVNMGYLGIDQAVKALNGEAVAYNVDSGCKLITRGNMYIDENQRLLYPFSGQQ